MRPRLITAENGRAFGRHVWLVGASMRPRLITAENAGGVGGGCRGATASMRPRLITAENPTCQRRSGRSAARFNEAAAHHRGERRVRGLVEEAAMTASMRPRLITAENAKRKECDGKIHGASMRPRLITAENFHTTTRHQADGRYASMRPRLITAENMPYTRARDPVQPSFNEAAAHHRGERRGCPRWIEPPPRFNEAAAHHRGERPMKMPASSRSFPLQ